MNRDKKGLIVKITLLCLIFLFFTNSLILIGEDECLIQTCFNFFKKEGLKFPDNVYILIDPGHGGDDPGCDNSNKAWDRNQKKWITVNSETSQFGIIYEKNVALVYAKLLKNLLLELGYKNVKLTRDTDITLKNALRAQMIYEYLKKKRDEYRQKCKGDVCCDVFTPIFISLHCDGTFPQGLGGSTQIYAKKYKNLLPKLVDSFLGPLMPGRTEPVKEDPYTPGLTIYEGSEEYENSGLKKLKKKEGIFVYHDLCEIGFLRKKYDLYMMLYRSNLISERIIKALVSIAMMSYHNFGLSFNLCKPIDSADDNYSYADSVYSKYIVDMNSEILIPFEFLNPDSLSLLNKVLGPTAVYAKETNFEMVKKHPVMVIPSGALTGIQNNSTFKHILEQYVSQGGTIIVFSQQYGSHVDSVIPTPEGEFLKSYGWREDQSCLRHSCYYPGIHPVVSSSTSERVHVGVDGNLQCQMFDVKCQKLNV